MKDKLLEVTITFMLQEGYDINEVAKSPAQKHPRMPDKDCDVKKKEVKSVSYSNGIASIYYE